MRLPLMLLLGILLVLLGAVLIAVGVRQQSVDRRPPSGVSPPVPSPSPSHPSVPTSGLPEVYRNGVLVTIPISETGEGREAVVPDGTIRIEFLDVLGDSRCPARVVCVWSGEARIRARIYDILPPGVMAKRSPSEPIELTIPGSRRYALPSPANIYAIPSGGWSVIFARLDPYPQYSEDLQSLEKRKADYQATFVVLLAAEADRAVQESERQSKVLAAIDRAQSEARKRGHDVGDMTFVIISDSFRHPHIEPAEVLSWGKVTPEERSSQWVVYGLQKDQEVEGGDILVLVDRETHAVTRVVAGQ